MRSSRYICRATVVLLAALLGSAGCFTDVTHPQLDGGGAGRMSPVDGNIGSGGAATVDGRGDAVLVNDGGSGGSGGGAGGAQGGALPDDASATGGVGGETGNPDAVSSTGGSAGGSGGGGGGSLGDGPSIPRDVAMAPDVPADVPVAAQDVAPNQSIGNDADVPSALGAVCQAGSTCASKNCVDGVCCDTTCTGCNACSNTLTGKADGTCSPVITGQDPHNYCTDETASNQCGNDGTCDGAGACRKTSSSHVCTPASCSAGIFTPAATCDGLGACKTVTPQDCGAFQCDTTGCLKTCTLQTDCDSTSSYCNTATGKCTAKGTNGTPASQTYECTSGVVADGVCCDKACTGCYGCTNTLTAGATGQCLPISAGQVAHSACVASGTTCGLDGTCDGAGACRFPKAGTPCDDGNACTTDACQSGACVGTPVTCTAGPCQVAGTCSAGACPTPISANNGTRDPRCLASTPVCVGGQCAQCFSDSDCSSTPITPSCDPSNHTCACRRPSASNLVQNPGFNTSLAGWSAYFPPMESSWTTDDSENCPGSGSVAGSVYGTDNDPMQCVPLSGAGGGAGTYYFGAKFKLPLNGNGTQCELAFASDQFCSNSAIVAGPFYIGPNGASYPGSGWQNLYTTATAPAGTASAYIACSFDVTGGTTKIDQIYLNKSANGF